MQKKRGLGRKARNIFRKTRIAGGGIPIRSLLAFWVFIVTVYFLWEAAGYQGLYALLSEWQLDQFGRYLPVLTFSFLVLLFGSPIAWLLRHKKFRRRKGAEKKTEEDVAIATGLSFRNILLGFAGGLCGAAVLCLVMAWTQPVMKASERTISAAFPADEAIAEGPATLQGEILFTRTSAFTQDLLFKQRGVRFAPMVAPGAPDTSSGNIDYFVELPMSDRNSVETPEVIELRSGILQRNSLPGSIVRLYRYAGYELEHPYYVLYTSVSTMRWPYYVAAAQLAIAAFLALLAALFQHRQINQWKPEGAEGKAA